MTFDNLLNRFKTIQFWLLLFLPVALVTGPFLSDLSVSLISIIFLVLIIRKKEYFYFQHPFSYIFFAWSLYLILSSLFSQNLLLSLESSLFYWRFGFFSLAVWYVISNNPLFIRYFTIVFFITYLILLVDGYIQFFTGTNILGFPKPDYGLKVSGFFGEEAILGSFLSRNLPLLLGLILLVFSRIKYYFILVLILFIGSAVLIFVSGERTSFFYIILTIIIMLFTKKNKAIFITATILSFSIITLIIFTNDKVKTRMIDYTISQFYIDHDTLKKNNIAEATDKKINSKFSFFGNKIKIFSIQHHVVYASAFKMFLDHPLIGIGPKMFREICKESRYKVYAKDILGYSVNEDQTITGCQSHPHNTYFQLLSETGVIGFLPIFIAFLFVCVILIIHFWKIIRRKEGILSDFQLCLYTSVLISLWPFVPTGNLFHNWTSIIYFLPIGFIIQTYNKGSNKLL